MLKLSYSKINDFLTCPKRYELIHILHLLPQENENIYTAFGSAVHYAIEQCVNKELDKIALFAYFKSKFNLLFQKIPVAQRQVIFKSEWENKGYEMLTYFFDKLYDKVLQGKVKVEHYFSFQIDSDTTFNGLIDLIYLNKKKSVELWDWKTGKKMDKADNLQLRLYALFFQKEAKITPSSIKYIFLKSGTKNATKVNFDLLNETEQELNKIVSQIKDSINKNEFPRCMTPSCKYCPVYKICNQKLREENTESGI